MLDYYRTQSSMQAMQIMKDAYAYCMGMKQSFFLLKELFTTKYTQLCHPKD